MSRTLQLKELSCNNSGGAQNEEKTDKFYCYFLSV